MTAINFPANPSNGDTHQGFVYNSTLGVWQSAGSQTAVTSFTGLSDTPSTLGTAGQIAKVNSGATALEFADQSGVTVYATADLLPGTANAGDMAFVTATNRLYLWNGSGWYNIALINTNPSISGASSSYDLATDGTPTTVTITATDPEGVPITYSIVSDTSGNIATVSQGTGSNSNVFTITPSTDSANAGSFILTFRASDGVNIASSVSTFTLSFSVPNSKYTTALITSVGANDAVNNSFTDSSGNSHTITSSGGVGQGTFSPFRQSGYSWEFDGTDDFIEGPAVDLMGSGAFTVECWAYVRSTVSTATDAFLAQYQSNQKFIFGVKSDVVRVWMAGTEVRVGTTNIIGEWHHFALVRDSSNSCQVYIDGVAEGAAFTNTTDFSTSLENFEIGSWDNGGGSDLDGYITDLRVVKGTAVYTAAFVPPTERLTAVTNTSLLLGSLPYLAEGSTNNHKLTSNGTPSMQPFTPYDNGGEYTAADYDAGISFNGTDSFIQADTAVDAFTTASTDWTIEAWVYPRDIGGGNAGADNWVSANRASDGHYVFAIGPNQITLDNNYEQNLTNMAVNQWHHIAAVNSGGYNGLKYFINGYHVNSYNPSATSPSLDVCRFVFGASLVGATVAYNHFDGILSNVRVSDTDLYTNSDYTPTNPPTQTFTPPTAPFTTNSNTDFLLYGRNAAIIDKSQSVKSITLNGDVKSSTAQTKYLSSSMYFDGTGDVLYTESNVLNNFGTRDFTLEAWIYPTAYTSSGWNTLFAIGNSTNAGGLLIGKNTSEEFVIRQYGTADRVSYSTLPSLNTWTHIACVRSNGTSTIYYDGVAVASASDSTSYSSTTPFAHVGNSDHTTYSHYWNGYVEDLRFTPGFARYTANFTPPTAALKG